MEYLYEYLQHHSAAIIFACINIICFLTTMIISCTENKHAIKWIIGYVFLTVCTIIGTIVFDSVVAMVVSTIFWLVMMLITCCVLLVIVGLAFTTSKIYLTFHQNEKT